MSFRLLRSDTNNTGWVTIEGNVCEKQIDQLLFSPRLCHRALDVSMVLWPLSADTDITYIRKFFKLSTTASVTTGGCNVKRVHGFDKDGSRFRIKVPSVAYMRVTLRANETLYELQFSHI